jgi:hypothetical protein
VFGADYRLRFPGARGRSPRPRSSLQICGALSGTGRARTLDAVQLTIRPDVRLTSSVDRADARYQRDVVALAQRSKAAEHLGPHCLDVLRAEAAHPAGQPHSAEQASLLPASSQPWLPNIS